MSADHYAGHDAATGCGIGCLAALVLLAAGTGAAVGLVLRWIL